MAMQPVDLGNLTLFSQKPFDTNIFRQSTGFLFLMFRNPYKKLR